MDIGATIQSVNLSSQLSFGTPNSTRDESCHLCFHILILFVVLSREKNSVMLADVHVCTCVCVVIISGACGGGSDHDCC